MHVSLRTMAFRTMKGISCLDIPEQLLQRVMTKEAKVG